MNNKYDWDWVREYYSRSQQNSRTTLKELATLFDIPYQTIRLVAAKENWVGHVTIFRDNIDSFIDLQHQQRYLELAVALTHHDYTRLDEMEQLDEYSNSTNDGQKQSIDKRFYDGE